MQFGKADREYRELLKRLEENRRMLEVNHHDIKNLRRAQAQMLGAMLEQAKSDPIIDVYE